MPSASKYTQKQLGLSLLVLQVPFNPLENSWIQTEEFLIQEYPYWSLHWEKDKIDNFLLHHTGGVWV